MDLKAYSELASQDPIYIDKAISIVESMLGYTLDPTERLNNEVLSLEGSYRLFSFHKSDLTTLIDPATIINDVKIISRGEIEDVESYEEVLQPNFIKYLEIEGDYPCGCGRKFDTCSTYKIAVDADWAFDEGEIPDDLISIIADMSQYYADSKKDIRSESLGTHSYTRFDRGPVELYPENLKIIKKYAGPKGTVKRPITI